MSNENPNEPPNIPPPVQNPGWNPPPQVQGPQPGPQMPSYYQQPGQSNSTLDSLIPTKNPNALIAYYLGVFSLVCGLLAPIALGLGIKGLNDIKKQPGLPGKGHAIAGIVMGSIITLAYVVLIVALIIATMTQKSRGY